MSSTAPNFAAFDTLMARFNALSMPQLGLLEAADIEVGLPIWSLGSKVFDAARANGWSLGSVVCAADRIDQVLEHLGALGGCSSLRFVEDVLWNAFALDLFPQTAGRDLALLDAVLSAAWAGDPASVDLFFEAYENLGPRAAAGLADAL